ELREAVSVALVPIATRQGLLGVLEIWQEREESTFDARMLYLLETLALLAAMVVENDRLHRASLERERLHSEFEIGSRIQQVLLQGQTMPLGFTQGEVYVPVITSFAAGDVILFYSDGVTETTNAAGEFYGEIRLAELVRSNHYLDPSDIVEIIRQDVLSYSRT